MLHVLKRLILTKLAGLSNKYEEILSFPYFFLEIEQLLLNFYQETDTYRCSLNKINKYLRKQRTR